MSQKNFRVAIIGGGLVGALEACLMADRGFDVTLFESRQDGRNESNYYGRSINLAISTRGISALQKISMEHLVEELAIPMKARMIHDLSHNKKDFKTHSIPYNSDGKCINSIERSALNNHLLNEAERKKVKVVFNYKLVDISTNNQLSFRLRQSTDSNFRNFCKDTIKTEEFDLVLGCDGARSTVRNLISRVAQFNVSQEFIEHGYIELRIDASHDKSFAIPENYLHIWPRQKFMMIALPNKDLSFTCTLFMPFSMFNLIRVQKSVSPIEFFNRYFPDAIKLIGEKRIEDTLLNIEPSPLIFVKCDPYHLNDKVALLGDAAHAIVPFYGQGMNCGFEDCLVLDELMDDFNGNNMGEILQMYTKIRCPNGKAMADLALYNYIEMRDLVNSRLFKYRKSLDNVLYKLFKDKWTPLYTMVTFTRIPIDKCIRRRQTQDLIVRRTLIGTSSLLFIGLSIYCHKYMLGKFLFSQMEVLLLNAKCRFIKVCW